MFNMRSLVGVLSALLVLCLIGQALAQTDAGPVSSGTVLAPETQESEFTIRTLFVNAEARVVIVQYDVVTPGAVVRRNQQGRFFLDNDASINYKMAMLMLLRDAMINKSLRVFISILPETENTSLKIIQSVALK